MLNFLRLTLADIDKVKPFFRYALSRACDNTIGGMFIWRDLFSTEYAIVSNTIVFKVKYFNGTTAFSLPLGEALDTCLRELKAYCDSAGIPLVFSIVSKEDVAVLRRIFDIEIKPERDWFDYLYVAEDLATLAGKRYNGQRNHINYFKRTFPDYAFAPVDAANLPSVLDFHRATAMVKNTDSFIYKEECVKIFEVLENYDAYGFLGGVIYAMGRIVAFSIGEIFGDTLYVHIEKAETGLRGAYPMIVSEFVKHYAADGIRFVNREDDVGDDGLRTSKLSYHPCELLEKYTVTVK